MTVSTDGRAFVDTNVLVYCYDQDNEFYAVVTSEKRAEPMMPTRAKRLVEHYIVMCRVVPLAASTTQLALSTIFRHKLSFWDALIWAAAKEHDVPVIYSEDFQHNQEVEGVRFINPFAA